MVVGSSPVVVVCSGSREEGGVHRKDDTDKRERYFNLHHFSK